MNAIPGDYTKNTLGHGSAEQKPKMRDSGMIKVWTMLVSASVIAITVWTVHTVSQHESQIAEHTTEIRNLRESVKDMRDDIRVGFQDIKKDLKEINK